MAFCSEGLTGIKFIFTNSGTSGWVGDNSGPGIAQEILSIPARSDWYCILVGLDYFKIVSLGLGHSGSVKLPSQDAEAMDSCVQSHLWTPHPPRHEDLAISTLLPSPSASPDDPANTAVYDWRDVWCRFKSSAKTYQRLMARDRVYAPPRESRLVGIYMGCHEFSCVGALYDASHCLSYLQTNKRN